MWVQDLTSFFLIDQFKKNILGHWGRDREVTSYFNAKRARISSEWGCEVCKRYERERRIKEKKVFRQQIMT